jgi:hypothetical protein
MIDSNNIAIAPYISEHPFDRFDTFIPDKNIIALEQDHEYPIYTGCNKKAYIRECRSRNFSILLPFRAFRGNDIPPKETQGPIILNGFGKSRARRRYFLLVYQ